MHLISQKAGPHWTLVVNLNCEYRHHGLSHNLHLKAFGLGTLAGVKLLNQHYRTDNKYKLEHSGPKLW